MSQPNTDTTSTPKKSSKSKGDRIVIDIFSDTWSGVPSNITTKKLNVATNVKFFKDFPIAKSPISLAVGIGLDAHNFKSNGSLSVDTSSNSIFLPLPDTLAGGTIVSYKKNKLTVAYFDIPIEFRFRSKNQTGNKLKFALGFQAGILMNKHTKYKGIDLWDGTGKIVKKKTHDIKNLEKFRYGFTARFGYGMYNIMFYYSLTELFQSGKGPALSPMSIGISLNPFN